MTDQITKRLVANSSAFMTRLVEHFTHDFSDATDSPIERLFGSAASISMDLLYSSFAYHIGGGLTFEDAEKTLNRHDIDGMLFAQVKVGSYRVDFLLLHRSGIAGNSGIVIECDGHDFHEKTKEQVARDKARDRALSARGLKVMRFAGSEIWSDPFACAFQVFEIAEKEADTARLLRRCVRRGDLNGLNELAGFVDGGQA